MNSLLYNDGLRIMPKLSLKTFTLQFLMYYKSNPEEAIGILKQKSTFGAI